MQILNYYLIYLGPRKVFCKIIKSTFLSGNFNTVFNRCLINNILYFKSNWFELKLKKINLNWRQEVILIAFRKYFTWHTQNTIWEIFKFQEYFPNMYPCFHEHIWLRYQSFSIQYLLPTSVTTSHYFMSSITFKKNWYEWYLTKCYFFHVEFSFHFIKVFKVKRH